MTVLKSFLTHTFAKVCCSVLASATLASQSLAVVFGPTARLQRGLFQKPMALWAHTEDIEDQKAVCFYETPYEALPASAHTSFSHHFFKLASAQSQRLLSHFITVEEADYRLYTYRNQLAEDFDQRLELAGVQWNTLPDTAQAYILASCSIGALIVTSMGVAALGPLGLCPALVSGGGFSIWLTKTRQFKDFLTSTPKLKHSLFLLSNEIRANPYGYQLLKKGLEELNSLYIPAALTQECPPPSSLFPKP